MSTNTSGGTTTSLNNTPQAQSDTYQKDEDSLGVTYLNVMSNDLGGNAKVLWSVDDGSSSLDLVSSDIGTVEATSSDHSAHGAKIWVENGQVGYDGSTLDAGFKSSLQALAVGETTTDTFIYAIRMSNGTLSWNTVTIVYTGSDDAPDISIGSTDSASACLTETNDPLVTSGTLTVVDPDTSDNDAVSITAFSKSGNAGSLTDAQLQDMLKLASSTLAANTGDSSNLTWNFNSGTVNFDYLAAGETLTLTYTVTADDGHNLSDTQTITITIKGTNDGPEIVAGGTVDGGITEDSGTYSASGSFGFTDVDSSDHHTVTVSPDHSGYLGTLTASVSDDSTNDGSGTVGWSFNVANADLQFLGKGETLTQTYTLTVDDGHGGTRNETVTVVLTGDEDPVVITSAAQSQSISEDGTSVGGTITFNDVDLSDTHTASAAANAANTTHLGTFAIDASVTEAANAANGSLGWTYTVDNNAAQYLAAGESVVEKYDVTFDDGHGSMVTETVTVTITGSNDGPAIVSGGDIAGGVEEESGTYTDSGSFGFTDVDSSDHHTASVSPDHSGYLGLLTASVTDDSTGDGSGTITWNFSVDNADLQFLAEGQTLTQTYTVTVDDGHSGGTAAQTVTIVLTGDEDPVVITSAAQSESISEDGTSVGGAITFTDPDLSDTHTAGFVPNAANTTSLGTFSIDPSVTEAPNAADGSLGWSYTVDNAAAQYLAQGESAVEKYDVTFDDGHGSMVTETVTVTITGSNDGPDISAIAGDSASADLDETDTGLTASGTLTVTDPDTSDAVDTTVTNLQISGNHGSLTSGDLLGMFSITDGATGLAANTGDTNNLTWSFDSDTQAFDFLAEGQTLTLTYTLTSDDGHGGTDTQDVTVTITGTNDAPELTASLTSATYTDTAADDTFNTVSGALTTVDPDTGDTATYSIDGGAADNSHLGYDTSASSAYGTLYLNSSSGEYLFVPNDGAIEALKTSDSASFTLTVTDSQGASDSQTLTINVDGANDTPELTASVTSATFTDTAGDDTFLAVTGDLSSTDRDSPETATYGVLGGVSDNSLSGYDISKTTGFGTLYVDSVSGNYTFVPNDGAIEGLKTDTSLFFTLQVTDGSGATANQTLTINLDGVNDTPDAPATNGVTTDEDTASAAVAINATDRDSGETLTYTVKAGEGPSIGSVAFDQTNGTFTYTPDHDANGSDSFTILITDGSGATTEQVVSVTVNPVNDPPVITSDGGGATASVNVAENSTAVTTVTATDIDSPMVTFSISGGADAGKFQIDATTGALTFITAPDFENPQDAGGNNVYDVQVTASDGTATDTQSIAVTVTNVNEAPVITSDGGGANASLNVAENSTAVTTVTASDPDGDSVTFSITGGVDAGKFHIDATTGALTFITAPDFENPQDAGGNNVYDVQVTVSDGSLTDAQSIAVTVTNENDNPPVITSNGGGDTAAVSVAENSTAVTTVIATDADGDVLTYSITGGADSGKFQIDPNSGVLTFITAPDFENPQDAGGNNVYDVQVTASDGTNVDTQSIAVTVTNQNDNAPTITSNGGGDTASVNVPENSTAVTTVTATDADGDTLTYSITGGADAGLFHIDPTSGALTFVTAPDFENPQDAGANNVYDVQVTASDGTHADTQSIAVAVTDQPPAIDSNGAGPAANVSISENTTAVTTVHATDPAGGAIIYSIAGGADAAKFTIDSSTGALSFVNAPNFESPTDSGGNNVYDVTVRASDASGAFDDQAIAVAVTDVAENSLFFAINVAGSEGADDLKFANFTITIGSTVYHLSDLTVVSQSGYVANPNGTDFDLGPAGGGSHTIVFRLDNAPTTGSVQVHFDYSSINGGNTTNDGPIFSIGTTASAGTQFANYANTTSPTAWVGNVATSSRAITFDYNIAGSTVNVSNIHDPIILDLGLHGISLSNTVMFDMDADGHAQSIAWTNGEDGILVVDLNGDGQINSGNEILSPYFNGGGFAHSLDALASLDSNADGVLDANDAAFAQLRVWVDANNNGVTDSGELRSLSDLGITSISLATLAGSGAIDGQNVLANGTFSYADGSTGDFSAVDLTETSNTRVFMGQATEAVTGTDAGDLLFASNLGNAMFGGAGDDVLYSGGGDDTLSGGDGNDVFVLASTGLDTISDYAPGDTIDLTSILNVATDIDVVAGGYVRVTTSGLVQVDVDGGGDNWVTIASVNVGVPAYTIAYGSGESVATIDLTPVAPPIGIDLDGDGHVSFLGTDAGVGFDYGGGIVSTAWVAPQDGILVRDANGDGKASADEIVFATSGSDLQGLAQYDSNHDGQLSAADSAFGQFAVWQDSNSNGVVDSGEMKSLTALGIASISLSSDGIGYSAANGDVSVVGTGSFTRNDGTTGVLADAVFATAQKAASDEVRLASGLGNNVALLGAVAAAGLASMPAHATWLNFGDVRPDGSLLHETPQTSATVTTATPEANHALGNESAVPLGTATAAPASHLPTPSAIVPEGHQSTPHDEHSAVQPTELLRATDALHDSASATSSATATPLSSVSAEMLQAAMAGVQHASESPVAAIADGVHATAELGHVLADALESGARSGPDLDSLLETASGNGHFQAAHSLGIMGAPAGDAIGLGHFGLQPTPILETLELHTALPPHA